MPDRFVTILNEENKDPQYYYIEKKGEKYIYESSNTTIKISKEKLESQWNGIVLLIEKLATEKITKSKKNKWFGLLSLLGFIKFQLKDNQFVHNYDAFKNSLLSSNQIQNNLKQSAAILLGNTEAKLKIILVTNPFSSYCKEVHSIMEEILQKYSDLVCFDIRFNFNNNEYSGKKSKKVHQQLVALYQEKGQAGFIKGFHNWFEDKDENKLYATQISPSKEFEINEILSNQFNSNLENDLIFTPQIIINQYVFPKQYDQKELIHFIKELSKDEFQ